MLCSDGGQAVCLAVFDGAGMVHLVDHAISTGHDHVVTLVLRGRAGAGALGLGQHVEEGHDVHTANLLGSDLCHGVSENENPGWMAGVG